MSRKPLPIAVIVLAQMLKMCCYGFVLMSSGVGAQDINIFEPGAAWIYNYESTILLNDREANAKDVGFHIKSIVTVESVWKGENYERLLRIKMDKLKLHIRSRKAPSPDGFSEHSSPLESFINKPFYVLWNKGNIEKLLFSKNDAVIIRNIKKGITSLLQFQVIDQETIEIDASGKCEVKYLTTSPTSITKIKNQCISEDLLAKRNPKPLLDTLISSETTTKYDLVNDHIEKITSIEKVLMTPAIQENVGSEIVSKQQLHFERKEVATPIRGNKFDEVFEQLNNQEGPLLTHSLLTEMHSSENEPAVQFTDAIKTHKEVLKPEHLGSVQSAKAFMNLVAAARRSKQENISKALLSKKNKAIIYQLYDALGYVQTLESHSAVMKQLHFDNEDNEDGSERYLWALSLHSQPNPEIIKDLLNKYRHTEQIPLKVKETMILTIASMTHNLNLLGTPEKRIQRDVEDLIVNLLSSSKKDHRYQYLRALRNLLSPSTIPTLLEIISQGPTKERIMAWKVLNSFDAKHINVDVLKAARTTFYQLDKIHDSSERTIAFDVIFNTLPKDEVIQEFVQHLRYNDTAYEVKKYIFESMMMQSTIDPNFKETLEHYLKKDPLIFNYNVMGMKGLSLAIVSQEMKSGNSGGRIQSVHEVDNAVLKRGLVSLVLSRLSDIQDFFTLEIFTGGVDSVVNPDVKVDSLDKVEPMTAGMEISMMGTQIRPFTFFTGQGELMGHVWSGTGSERSSAFQIGTMLQDHQHFIRLGSGYIAEYNLKGSGSLDLSGKIEVSLWNRNADGYVEKSGGFVLVGITNIDTPFVYTHVEYSLNLEPKLKLETTVDFYNTPVQLCLRLAQPDSVFRYNVYKIERIPNSKHKLRIKKSKKCPVVGKTYWLNRINSDMCKAMSK